MVLARALRLVADGPLDVAHAFSPVCAADPAANAYLVDLTAAGGGYAGTALVGASPELLVARRGERGDLPAVRGLGAAVGRPRRRRASGAALAESAKNRHEHQLVVDEMREVLDPLCVDLQIAPEPKLQQHRRRCGICSTPIYRSTARNINHRTGSRARAAPDTGGRRRACREPPPS